MFVCYHHDLARDLTDASTGQVDMLTRLYEPTLGRFSSRDVLFGDPTTARAKASWDASSASCLS